MNRALLLRNPALRTVRRWLLFAVVAGLFFTGLIGLRVAATGEVTRAEYLGGAWVLVGCYLLLGQVRLRCTRFDLSLPVPARELWSASLLGSVLAAWTFLAMLFAVSGLQFAVFDFLSPQRRVDWPRFAVDALVLAAAVVPCVAALQARRPELAEIPGGRRHVLASLPALGAVLLLLVLFAARPWYAAAIALAAAVPIVAAGARRVPPAYGVAPLADDAAPRAVRAAPAAAGARPRALRGLRRDAALAWIVVRTAPKGKGILWMAAPVLCLFGLVDAGVVAALAPDSDLRFTLIPITAYMLVSITGQLLANLRWVDAWPADRRRIFAPITLACLLLFVLGYAAGGAWVAARPSTAPPGVVAFDGASGERVETGIPRDRWRIDWDGRVPAVGAQAPRTTPVVRGWAPLAYGSAAAPPEGRGPHFPLMLALIAVCWFGGLALYLPRLKAGSRRRGRQAVFAGVLGVLMLLHLAPYVLLFAGLSRPWVWEVLFTDTARRLLEAVPGGAAGMWVLSLAVTAGMFELALRAFRRTESPVELDACAWEGLTRGSD
ncbi:MAG: hypothetical protein IPH09_04705 [bacterium]|nr:hypothetical protein [bacterium]